MLKCVGHKAGARVRLSLCWPARLSAGRGHHTTSSFFMNYERFQFNNCLQFVRQHIFETLSIWISYNMDTLMPRAIQLLAIVRQSARHIQHIHRFHYSVSHWACARISPWRQYPPAIVCAYLNGSLFIQSFRSFPLRIISGWARAPSTSALSRLFRFRWTEHGSWKRVITLNDTLA